MKPLTRKDMYDKDNKCILPHGCLPKKHQDRSKYVPAIEDKKHREKLKETNV